MPADPIAAVVHGDPYPYYAELAATSGARWHDDHRLWFVAATADVNEVLDDADCHVRPIAEPVPLALVGTAAGDLFVRLARTTEGECHERARAAAERALVMFDLAAIPQVVAREARGLMLDRFVATIAVRVVAGRSRTTGDQVLVVPAAADPPPTFGSARHACPGSSVAVTVAAAAVAWLDGDGRALIEGVALGGYVPSVNVRTPRFVADR